MILVISVFCFWMQLQESQTEKINFDLLQDDYKVRFERAELLSYNKEYYNYVNLGTFKYNRTVTAFNYSVSYKMDMNTSMQQVIFQAYKLASNEYRQFPLRFQTNFCNVFEQDLAGLRSFKGCRNFQGCPFKRNIRYYICNFIPDSSKLPRLIPNGKYKLEGEGFYGKKTLFKGEVYAEVYRPII